jgi:nitrite reductase/ring-hydroxylating ferredoxin subunit
MSTNGSLAGLTGVARQRASMRDMQRRMVKHIGDGMTTDLTDEPMAVDAGVYTDPARLDAEYRALFHTLPMVAGLSCDLPEPGDWMTFDAAGPSILIVRGKDSVVRAFLNSCSHRGARIVKDCAKGSRVSCPFHSWTYDYQGRVIGIPGQVAFEGIDRESLSLTAVPVTEWQGLILVKVDPKGSPIDAEEYFGPMADEIRQLGLQNAVPIKKSVVNVAANWKFAQDTFFEGYHFSSLHPQTINQVAFSNVCIHDTFGPHQRVNMPLRMFEEWVGKPESEWGEVPYNAIHLLFPNTIMYVGSLDGLIKDKGKMTSRQIFGFWRSFPKGPNESFTMMATYRPSEHDAPETLKEYEETTDFIIKVVETEDYSMCADGQKNLKSMLPGQKLWFGRNEPALQSIHRNIEAHLEGNGSPR